MDETQKSAGDGDGRSERINGNMIETVVAAAIRDFMDGHYAPGQRLVESDLIRRYKVGRGTIREAIRRLSGEGLVTVHRFRGASIRTLSRTEVLDLMAILEVLNGLAARKTAERIDDDGNRARFIDAYEALMSQRGKGDFFAAIRCREAFFSTIVAMSDSGELDRVVPKLQLLIARIQVPNAMDETERYDDYRYIGEAILAGDPDFAEFVARRHIRHAIASFSKLPDSHFRDEI